MNTITQRIALYRVKLVIKDGIEIYYTIEAEDRDLAILEAKQYLCESDVVIGVHAKLLYEYDSV